MRCDPVNVHDFTADVIIYLSIHVFDQKMFNYSRYFKSLCAASSVTGGLVVGNNIKHKNIATCTSSGKESDTNTVSNNPPHNDVIAVYLTSQSKEALSKYLYKKGLPTYSGKYVVIKNNASKDDSYVYEPLYGERAAFRLKGFVKTSDGRIACKGRISSMIGEIRDDNFDPSLPLHITDSNSEADDKTDVGYSYDNATIDLVTRFNNVTKSTSMSIWKGRLPADVILGNKHDAVKANSNSFGMNDQCLLDGYICSSKYIDSNGDCKFDRSTGIVPMQESNTSTNSESSGAAFTHTNDEETETSSTTTTIPSGGSDSGDETECPMCRFMKGGSCKDEFLQFEECMKNVKEIDDVSVCAPLTVKMMKCFTKDEYYDIMIAGTGIEESIDRIDKLEEVKRKHEQDATIKKAKDASNE